MKKGVVAAIVILFGVVPLGTTAYFIFSPLFSNVSQNREEKEKGINFTHEEYVYTPRGYHDLEFSVPSHIRNASREHYDFKLTNNTADAFVTWRETGFFGGEYYACIYAYHPGNVTLDATFDDGDSHYVSKTINFTFSDKHVYTTDFYDDSGTTLLKSFKEIGDKKITLPDVNDKNFIGWSNGIDFIEKDNDNFYLYNNTKFFAVIDREASKGLQYSVKDDGVIITGYNGIDYDVVIPTYIDGKPVVEIGSKAFSEKGITSVRIPIFVKKIAESAFYKCKFNECIFEKGSYLKTLDDYAFYNTNNLRNILLGAQLNFIGSNALDIPNDKLTIGFEAPNDNKIKYDPFAFGLKEHFTKAYNVQQFVKKDSTNHYEYLIYNDNTTGIIKYLNELTDEKLTLDEIDGRPISRVLHNAFFGSDVNEVVFTESLDSIWLNAFRNCKQLTNIDFTNATSVRFIDESAFEDCSALTKIDLRNADKLSTIYEYAFKNCSNVRYAYLPQSLVKINQEAFYGIEHLMIFYEGNSDDLKVQTDWASESHSYYDNIGEFVEEDSNREFRYAITHNGGAIILDYFNNMKEIIDLDKIDGHPIVGIGYHAFESCPMQIIKIPETVEFISPYAFNGCNNLKSVEFKGESQLKRIGKYAFQRCISLRTITLPRVFERIGSYAFDGCKNLSILFGSMDDTSIKFDDNWNNMKLNYFFSVKQVHYQQHNEHGGYYYFETYQGTLSFLKWNGLLDDEGPTEDLVIDQINGKKFTEICKNAFVSRKANISAVGSSPKTINITLGDSIKVIGDNAFAHMYERTVNGHGSQTLKFKLKYSDNIQLETIGNAALASVLIDGDIIVPKSVTSIGSNAFGYSTYLKGRTIWMCANNATNIRLGEGWNGNQEVVWGDLWHYNEHHNPVKNA